VEAAVGYTWLMASGQYVLMHFSLSEENQAAHHFPAYEARQVPGTHQICNAADWADKNVSSTHPFIPKLQAPPQ